MLYLSGSYSHDGDPKAYPMRIGITCYPTYGGSGVVATELGMELAARGRDIHVISYAPPSRMNPNDRRIHVHDVEAVSYPPSDPPPYTPAPATKMLMGGAYLMKWMSWPRAASSMPSSVAT